MDRNHQSSDLKKKANNLPYAKNKDDDDDIPADALLNDLIDMQKDQLSKLMPEMGEGEEKSEQTLNSARLVLRDISNYTEKLSGIKQQYCNRLNQISSFLRMIPKIEKYES